MFFSTAFGNYANFFIKIRVLCSHATLPVYVGRHTRFTACTIRSICNNVEPTFSSHNVRVSIRQEGARSNKNFVAVQASIAVNRNIFCDCVNGES